MHTEWDKWVEIGSNIILGTALVLFVAATVYIWRKTEFSWVRKMFMLNVLLTVISMQMAFGDWLEESEWNFTHTVFTALNISVGCFLFFFLTILIYWLFGFKYWVISIEVPRFINGSSKMQLTERKYKLINYGFIALFGSVCLAACTLRYLVAMQFVDRPHFPTHRMLLSIFIMYGVICLLMVVAAVFLGDALRRLRKQILSQRTFTLAIRTMRLHIFVMFFHTISFTFALMAACSAFLFPTANSSMLILWNVSKLTLFFTQSISQGIIMYLIWKLNGRVVVKKEEDDDDVDSNDTESDFGYLMYMSKGSVRLNNSKNRFFDDDNFSRRDSDDDLENRLSLNEGPPEDEAESKRSHSETSFMTHSTESRDSLVPLTKRRIQETYDAWGGKEEAKLRAAIFVSFLYKPR